MQPAPGQPYQTPYEQTPQTQYISTQPQVVGYQQPGMQMQGMVQQPGMPMGTVVMGMPQTSATTALILSIVSIFFGSICLAIPALIMANSALNITSMYPGHPDSGTAKAAQIVSWIVIGLFVLLMLFYIALFASMA